MYMNEKINKNGQYLLGQFITRRTFQFEFFAWNSSGTFQNVRTTDNECRYIILGQTDKQIKIYNGLMQIMILSFSLVPALVLTEHLA